MSAAPPVTRDAALRRVVDGVATARATRTPLQLRGHGSKAFYGETPRGDVLDLAPLSGIARYEPTELVVTVRAGTPIAELEAALAEHGQCLAFDPPRFQRADDSGRAAPGRGTVGGMVAAGLAGPSRAAVGGVRDFVLGAALLNGDGEVLRFGGEVMKNVAGYDVSRLLAGSLGTLGLIVEVSLKLLPRPAMELTHRFEMPQAQALEALRRWGGQPLPISASAWRDGRLALRFSGAPSAVQEAAQKLGGESVPAGDAAAFWSGVREQTDTFFAGDAPLWRLSLPAQAPVLELTGEQLLEWGGALRWLRSTSDAATVRAAASRAGGHATLFRAADKREGAFAPLPPLLARLHRDLKKTFDPAGIFNPGRMYPEI